MGKTGVVGDGGSILHYDKRAAVGIPAPEAISKPMNLLLYPNPTNGYTSLEFDLSNSAMVEVKLFDLQERLVLAPVYTRYQTGHQSLVLDASTLKPGVYLFRLNAGDQWVLQKMVKI